MIKPNTFDELLLREKIMKLALMQLNKKYIHGSHGPNEFDCAGFVWYVYNEIMNIDLYKGGYGKSTTTKIMTSIYGILREYEETLDKDISLIKEGDILFFHRQSKKDNKPTEFNKYPGHCGIYLGDNSFIHCSRTKGLVLKKDFSSDYWKRILVGSKDIITDYIKKDDF